jgi:hypothetical protein
MTGPPDSRSGPGEEPRPPHAPAEPSPERPDTVDGDSAYVLRQGDLVRATTSRTTVARCHGCHLRFSSAGTAASHARTKRHIVSVAYSVEFTYLPVGGAR